MTVTESRDSSSCAPSLPVCETQNSHPRGITSPLTFPSLGEGRFGLSGGAFPPWIGDEFGRAQQTGGEAAVALEAGSSVGGAAMPPASFVRLFQAVLPHLG